MFSIFIYHIDFGASVAINYNNFFKKNKIYIMITPGQEMMMFIVEHFQTELEQNDELDRKLDTFWEKVGADETQRCKDFFIQGIIVAIKHKHLKNFNLDKQFDKFYNNLFPEDLS